MSAARPRVGFIGLGAVGAMRLRSAASSGVVEIAALSDASADRLEAAAVEHPDAVAVGAAEGLLARAKELALDGVVIATPNRMHAGEATAALRQGLAVFCQKPLTTTVDEARVVVGLARQKDLLLAVDWSYRDSDAARAIARAVEEGSLGRVFAVRADFHVAHGPDRAWCDDLAQAGGGALMDLGVHQLDMALHLTGRRRIESVAGVAFRDGERLVGRGIDDFATVRAELDDGCVVEVAAGWLASVGRDCLFRTQLHGTRAGAEIRNVGGSPHELEGVRHDGSTETVLTRESGAWRGRGVIGWCERLASGQRGSTLRSRPRSRSPRRSTPRTGADVPARSAPGRARPRLLLRAPRALRVTSAVAVLGALALVGLALAQRERSQVVAGLVVASVLLAMGGRGAWQAATTWSVSARGVAVRDPRGARGLRWREVETVGFAGWSRALVLRGADGARVRVPAHVLGFEALCREVTVRLRPRAWRDAFEAMRRARAAPGMPED